MAEMRLPTETELNRMAQLFYEMSGLNLPRMTDKPLVVKGLRAVFEAYDARLKGLDDHG